MNPFDSIFKTVKPFIIAFLGFISVDVIQIVKLTPVVELVFQSMIAILTIVYLLKKIIKLK